MRFVSPGCCKFHRTHILRLFGALITELATDKTVDDNLNKRRFHQLVAQQPSLRGYSHPLLKAKKKFARMAELPTETSEIPSWLPDRWKEELTILTAIYFQDDELKIAPSSSSDGHVTVQVAPVKYPCKVIFTLSDDYPSKAPARIEITEKDPQEKRLPDDTLQTILQALYQTAQESLGNSMIFTLVEVFKEQLRKHEREDAMDSCEVETFEDNLMPFPEGFARESESDEDCPKPKKKEKSKKKRQSTGDASVVQAKKPPMKTATDVIHRIMWDEHLDQKDFTVGYLDRFMGVMEQAFLTFDWGDIAEADFLALAVPRHRIQYFKYKDVIVWDKTQRLDLVFGSTGSGTTIRDVVKKFEKEDGHTEEKEACEAAQEDEEMALDGHETEGSKEDYEDLEQTEDNVENSNKKGKRSERVTHFLAVRITAPEVIQKVVEFQEKVCKDEEGLKKTCIPPEKLHVTLGVMRLKSPEEVELAGEVLKELEHDLALCFSPVTLLHFKKIECWQNRVVVSPVEGEEKERLQKGSDLISSKLLDVGINVKAEKRDFKPHLTAMKVKLSMRKKKKKFKISKDLIKNHEDTEFGCQDVDEICLCSMTEKPREDGFYHTLATVNVCLE